MYTQDTLRNSNYEGWVAWLDGTPAMMPDGTLVGYDTCVPILESVPGNPRLLSTTRGVKDREHRAESRNVMDWKAVPGERVVLLEVNGFRDVYKNQPLISIMKQPGRLVRFIQYKKSALVLNTSSSPRVIPGSDLPQGQARTGIHSWVVGYWDQSVGHAELWEIPAKGGRYPPKLELIGANHPCWPRPLGFGLAPQVLGLKEQDVPSVPTTWAA